jgi:hypothetical protein
MGEGATPKPLRRSISSLATGERDIPQPDDPATREAWEVELIMATGWTHQQVRRAPAWLVRGICWRIFAGRLWRPEIAEVAERSMPRSSFSDSRAWADAQRARVAANDYLRNVGDLLWPQEVNDGPA